MSMKLGLSLVEEEQIFEDTRENVTKDTSTASKIPSIREELLVPIG